MKDIKNGLSCFINKFECCSLKTRGFEVTYSSVIYHIVPIIYIAAYSIYMPNDDIMVDTDNFVCHVLMCGCPLANIPDSAEGSKMGRQISGWGGGRSQACD
jgi:hypothetical protein